MKDAATLATVILCISFGFLCTELNAQSVTDKYPVEDIFEQLSMDSEEETDWTNEIEELTERLQQPLNINTITKEQLELFPFLTEKQIENILAYLYIHGQMQTIYELQLIEDMDRETIQNLRPFVYAAQVKEKEKYPTIKNIIKYGKHEVLTRFDVPFYKRKAYKETEKTDNRYWGTPQYHSLRYSFRYRDNLYAGVTAEKDAGEPFFGMHNKKGYDYYSFYFYLRNIGKLKNLAIGNYRVSFGQGLVISQDFLLGKTTSFSTLFSRNNSIKKHSSTDEYNYLRGVAGAYQVGDFVLSAFYSHRSLDGIIAGDTITSIQKTGLHRTNREAERRNVLTLQLAGGNITYTKNTLKLGLTGIYYFFDKPYYTSTLSREYAKYNLRGTNFYNIGIDYKYRWNRFTLQGEVALDKNQSLATLNTISYSLSSAYRFMLVHRYYSYDYWAFFARSFSEGSSVQNENGWYLATEIAPLAKWKFFGSIDFFSFPWWKYRVDKPSQGIDGMLQVTYIPLKHVNMYLRYRLKRKERNITGTKDVRPYHHHRLRYQLRWDISNALALRTTLDYNRFAIENVSNNDGYQIAQTVSYNIPSFPLTIDLHGTYFHTTNYDARVYSYEKGLLYSFYVPSFYGEGHRITTNIRWDVNKYIMLITKFGQTWYYDRETISSGWDEINGNKKTDLQVQLRVKF